MEYTALTDLEILTRADRCKIPLMTTQERYNCIRKIKRRDASRPPVIDDQEGAQWSNWFQSNF
jgi:hypothetical protein